MIIDFSYDVDSYQELLAHYGNWPYTCPVCNAVGQWQRHGTYLRYLLVSEDDGYESVTVSEYSSITGQSTVQQR